MATLNSDQAWKKLGQENPYYGVITDEKYRNNNLSASVLNDFFESGQKYVDEVFVDIHSYFKEDFFPSRTLDFGCGTGRLVIPFSYKTQEIIGVDVSLDMLHEAELNCRELGVGNASFILSDDNLTGLSNQKFDLVNTYIVLQHMNISRGEKIIGILLRKLNRNGIGVIHFVFGRDASAARKYVNYFRCRVPYLHNVINVFTGKPYSDPLMQMNEYNVNRILKMLYQSGVREMKLKFTKHGGHLGAIITFLKQ